MSSRSTGNIDRTSPAQGAVTSITMAIGKRRYTVSSFAEASRMFCAARDNAMQRGGGGASRTPTPLLYNAAGELIGYVSYNGRVWAGHPRDWKPGAKPTMETAQ